MNQNVSEFFSMFSTILTTIEDMKVFLSVWLGVHPNKGFCYLLKSGIISRTNVVTLIEP